MKTILKRIAAYVIDLMILIILASLLSNIEFLNPQLNNYNKYYNKLVDLTNEYNSFTEDLEDYYENEELNSEDYDKLINDYQSYEKIVYSYYEDGKLEKEEYDDLLEEVKADYEEEYKNIYYKVEKNSTISYATYIIITILYFGIFNLITDGQTLGKKLFRLKIVKKDGSKANILNYILRSILLYNTIYYLVAIICVYTLNADTYYNVATIAYQIQYYLQLIIMFMIILSKDGRGLHDIIGNTKVIAFDREGNIIEEEPFIKVNEKLEQPQEEKKTKTNKKKSKVIDMPEDK